MYDSMERHSFMCGIVNCTMYTHVYIQSPMRRFTVVIHTTMVVEGISISFFFSAFYSANLHSDWKKKNILNSRWATRDKREHSIRMNKTLVCVSESCLCVWLKLLKNRKDTFHLRIGRRYVFKYFQHFLFEISFVWFSCNVSKTSRTDKVNHFQ